MNALSPTSTAPTGAPSPLEIHNDAESNGARMSAIVVSLATAALNARAPSRWTFKPLPRASAAASTTYDCGHTAAPRVFKCEELAAREMCTEAGTERLDRRSNLGERDGSVCVLLKRLRLDASEHRRTAAFPAVGVRHLAHDVTVATFAMRHQRGEVALSAGRKK